MIDFSNADNYVVVDITDGFILAGTLNPEILDIKILDKTVLEISYHSYMNVYNKFSDYSSKLKVDLYMILKHEFM